VNQILRLKDKAYLNNAPVLEVAAL
jgi:hypothetical protein